MDPKQQFFGRLGTLGGLGTLAVMGNPDLQGQAAGPGTLGVLGTLAVPSKHPEDDHNIFCCSLAEPFFPRSRKSVRAILR